MNLQLFAGSTVAVKIYSNDGLTLLMSDDFRSSSPLVINNTGCSYEGVQVFTYSGQNTFDGLTTTAGGTTATYSIGSEIYFDVTLCDFYVVESQQSTSLGTGSVFAGSNNIANVFVGDSAVSKVYYGSTLIWQKEQYDVNDYVLQVQKYTTDIYSDGTIYSDDSIIAFDVTAGVEPVSVKYGGITKTVSAGQTEMVVFGKYLGVDDNTPNSGNIVFSGGYTQIIPSAIRKTALTTTYYVDCVLGVVQYFNTQITDISYIMAGQTNISSFVIPTNVSAIGTGAFSGCLGLSNITIPSNIITIGEYSFYSSGLTSVTLPNDTEEILGHAFGNCPSLVTLTVGTGLISISEDAFSNCSGLHRINAPSYDMWLNITFGSWNDQSSWDLYVNNSKITTATIPNPMETTGDYVFAGCKSITSLSFASSVLSIGQSCFTRCINLSSITIPNTVTRIYAWAFSGCTKASSITIGTGVTNIGSSAFNGCTKISTFNFNAINCSNLGATNNNTFRNLGKDYSTGFLLTIGNQVTRIPSYFFYPNSTTSTFPNLRQINFTSTSVCTTIGNYAFSGNSKMTSLNLPNSITTINTGAFQKCTALKTIKIGSSTATELSTIGSGVFTSCTSATRFDIYATTVPTLQNSNAFTSTNKAPVYVPSASLSKYKLATNWSSLGTRLKGR